MDANTRNTKIHQLKAKGIPKGTKNGEEWAVNSYNNWAMKEKELQLDELLEQEPTIVCEKLQHWFVGCEGTKKKNLDVDTRRILFHSMARHIKNKKNWNIKDDNKFNDLRLVGNAYVREKRVDQQKT
jgi:hypothetical protein